GVWLRGFAATSAVWRRSGDVPRFAAIPLTVSWGLGVGAVADGFAARWLLGVCAGLCATAAEYIASASPQTSAVLVHNRDVTFMNVPPVWVLAPRTARRRQRSRWAV